MKNFIKIANFNTSFLSAVLATKNHLWNNDFIRKDFPFSCHVEADDILLRFNDKNTVSSPDDLLNNASIINYPNFDLLPQVRPLIFDLMRLVEGIELGKVLITKIPSGKRIYPHCDEGDYHRSFKRFHIILNNYQNSNFRCGEEKICPSQGDVFWFDNSVEHELINESIGDTISLIIDIKN